ncbi:acyl-coenzyme A thioesterase 9, mitochondrial-like isoform X2 [Pristis pectinata]|uniref:acyl-coenzyme A thioesterase 9, mitochondrial-like isoform X2 n=1 Tax=Pristis pectinata TaxID=685728 RepID=UPI00223DA39F|nr:acyl-coenzyme A thioesterase 9, mitochondrial-like isoform X2 [Pristis pectinata]
MYLRPRFWLLRGISSVLIKPHNPLSARLHIEGCCPELTEGESKLLMNDVRMKLQAIVGASKSWSEHLKSAKDRASLNSLLVESQESLPYRYMKDSYLEAYLPLGSQPLLREKYLNVHNLVRFGRILEDLDSFGVLISYTHAKTDSPRSPFSIVTALVDEIDLVKNIILPDCDLKFSGHVTWVGKSSMEVQMHVSQYQNGTFNPVLQATFVMVARDPSNKSAALINPLKPEGPEEENLFRQGDLNKAKRATLKETSLLKTTPNEDEQKIIHKMFLETLDLKTVSFRSRILPTNSMWMEDAKLKSLEICHPQIQSSESWPKKDLYAGTDDKIIAQGRDVEPGKERNIFNKIFGGFLMRKAFELAWANACVFGGSRPYPVAVDDILFQKPVEIGSLLYLSSQVCYTKGNYIQVRVHSAVVDPISQEHNTTNIFYFTFGSENKVMQVFPKSYGESMLYLDGKRHFKARLNND